MKYDINIYIKWTEYARSIFLSLDVNYCKFDTYKFIVLLKVVYK